MSGHNQTEDFYKQEIFLRERLEYLIINSPKTVKNRLCMRLVSREAAGAGNGTVPSLPFLDMELLFCLVVKVKDRGFSAVTVTEGLMRRLHETPEGLFSAARKTSPYLLPYSFHDVGKSLCGSIKNPDGIFSSCYTAGSFPPAAEESGAGPGLYFLSNITGAYGASSILYDGLLSFVSLCLGGNLYVLPSSVHEVLLIKESGGLRPEDMREIVREINSTVLDPCDILSGNIYFYRQDTDTLYDTAGGSSLSLSLLP